MRKHLVFTLTGPDRVGLVEDITELLLTYHGNVELSQLLFSKSYFTGLKASKASQSLAALNTFKTTEDLVYSIAQVYLQLQITKKQTEILNANLDRLKQLITIAEIQFQEGLIKKIDVDQLKVNRTNLSTELQQVQIGISQQLNLLKYYMGMPLDAEIHISDEIVETGKYPLAGNLILSENTNLKLLTKQFELSDLQMENIQAGYYPTLSAFLQFGWQGQTDR